MNPGEFDRLITLQPPTEVQQPNGEYQMSYPSGNWIERWAKADFVSEDERLIDEAIEITSVIRFTIRFERINEKYRVVYDNKTYNINGITPTEGRRNYMILDCESTSITNFTT